MRLELAEMELIPMSANYHAIVAVDATRCVPFSSNVCFHLFGLSTTPIKSNWNTNNKPFQQCCYKKITKTYLVTEHTLIIWIYWSRSLMFVCACVLIKKLLCYRSWFLLDQTWSYRFQWNFQLDIEYFRSYQFQTIIFTTPHFSRWTFAKVFSSVEHRESNLRCGQLKCHKIEF